jgi:hypothetical protein
MSIMSGLVIVSAPVVVFAAAAVAVVKGESLPSVAATNMRRGAAVRKRWRAKMVRIRGEVTPDITDAVTRARSVD